MSAYETAVAGSSEEVQHLAATAARYGYEGLVVADADRVSLAGVDADVDLVDGVTVEASDPETAAGRVGSLRSGGHTEYTVLTVVGGPPDVTRFASEDDRVDALLLPADTQVGFDHVAAASAADHGVAVALDLGGVLRTTGDRRARALRTLRRRREILADAGVKPLVTARPTSPLAVRAPRDLAAVGERVGLGAEAVREGLAGWGDVVERVRERTDPQFVEPGVRRGRAEEWTGGDQPSEGGRR